MEREGLQSPARTQCAVPSFEKTDQDLVRNRPKLATEKLCLMYHYEHELPVTIFRINVVFDDKYQDLSQETIQKGEGGIPPPLKSRGPPAIFSVSPRFSPAGLPAVRHSQ